jgi:recombination protein RecT
MFDMVQANPISKVLTVQRLLDNPEVQNRFGNVLGKRAHAFMSSILTSVNANHQLQNCEPKSVLASAMMAAVLDLPIENNLGFAYIVPYKSREGDKAQFQIGYKGLTQLALRSGMYETINTTVIRKGQEVTDDPISGKITVTGSANWDAPAIGYLAYLKLVNGFVKAEYWTKEQIEAHAEQYSKSWGRENSAWTTAFDAMALKTALRHLLTHYGIMSIEMQRAFTAEDNESNKEVNEWLEIQNGAAKEAWEQPIDAQPKEVAPEHPWSAEYLRSFLTGQAKDFGMDFKPSTDQIGLMVGMINEVFAPDKDADKIRRSCLVYLWNVDSSKKMTGPQVKATLDWLKPTKDSGGAYSPDPMAARELHAVWEAEQLAKGKTTLPGLTK